MKNYDYIIAGSGCAGLSLAYYLSRKLPADTSVLIIDREEKTQNDRTWCFWTSKTTAFDAIVSRSWHTLAFADAHGEYQRPLQHDRYQMIRSADFYCFTKAAINQHPNFQWLQADITRVDEDNEGPFVVAGGVQYRASWVFNSCFDWQKAREKAENANCHFLLQHFRGWLIHSEQPAFNPAQATLMDFRTEQWGNARFLYVLPFDEYKALVEYTVFSPTVEPRECYEAVLKDYIEQQIGVKYYTILETEQGAIPMTDMLLPEKAGQKIIYIGANGGAIKPTTGYAFLRIQQQARRIAETLVATGSPFGGVAPQRRFRFYDRLLLDILQNDGEQSAPIFSRLFRRNNIELILKFLDERTHLGQEISIFARLPLGPFLRALARVHIWPALRGATLSAPPVVAERRLR